MYVMQMRHTGGTAMGVLVLSYTATEQVTQPHSMLFIIRVFH